MLEQPLRHRDFTAPALDASEGEMEALVDVNGNGTHSAGIIAGEGHATNDLSLTVKPKETRYDSTPLSSTPFRQLRVWRRVASL
jgi:hypothetical protein